MRDAAEHRMVMVLVADGHSDVDIAKRTGVPRRTVSDWRRGRRIVGLVPEEVVASTAIAALPHREYAYLLGLYLGDGCLSPPLVTFGG